MRPLILWLIAICAFTLAVATCGDDDDDDSSNGSNDDDVDDDESDDDNDDDDSIDDDVDDDDDAQAECDTWTDSTSGLTWTVDPATTNPLMNWSDAVDFCEALFCSGYDDWRLPSISELRSLVRGCPNTETGGSCGVTDDCLEDDSCYSNGCEGCGVGIGPSDGCYWPDEITGDCPILWSSSHPAVGDWRWYISFGQAGLGGSSEGFGNSDARCVRGEIAPVEGK